MKMALSEEQKRKIREKANVKKEENEAVLVKYCKYCGTLIDMDADVCPACKRNLIHGQNPSQVMYVKDELPEKKGGSLLSLFIILLISIGLVLFLYFGFNLFLHHLYKPHVVEESVLEEAETERNISERKEYYGINDTVDLNGVIFTFLGTEDIPDEEISWLPAGNGLKYVTMEFEVFNGTQEDVTVSSSSNFHVYLDDMLISQSLVGWLVEDKGGLDGVLKPRDKMQGILCYKLPVDFTKVSVEVSQGKIPVVATFVCENVVQEV